MFFMLLYVDNILYELRLGAQLTLTVPVDGTGGGTQV